MTGTTRGYDRRFAAAPPAHSPEENRIVPTSGTVRERMMTDTWKEFEQNEITHSGAHYLMAIRDLIGRTGYARVSDVARELGITRGSASLALKTLREKELVEQDENRFLRLTETGERIGAVVHAQRTIVESFLRDVLHVAPDQAAVDACKLEHLLSLESGRRLLTFLQYVLADEPSTRAVLERFWEVRDRCRSEHRCPVCGDHECLAFDR